MFVFSFVSIVSFLQLKFKINKITNFCTVNSEFYVVTALKSTSKTRLFIYAWHSIPQSILFCGSTSVKSQLLACEVALKDLHEIGNHSRETFLCNSIKTVVIERIGQYRVHLTLKSYK